MIALLVFFCLMGASVWHFFGAVAALGSAGMWALAAIIAMVMGPKYLYVPRAQDE